MGYRLGTELIGSFSQLLGGGDPSFQIVENGAHQQFSAIEKLNHQADNVP